MHQYLIRGHKVTLCRQPPANMSDDSLLIASARDLRDSALTVKQLLGIYSGLPGAKTHGKVQTRAIAVDRLWTALEALQTRRAKTPSQRSERKRVTSKQARVIEMLRRPEGATVEAIAKKMSWQAHTVRGLIAGALKKKLGLNVLSEKEPGSPRRYRIAETRH